MLSTRVFHAILVPAVGFCLLAGVASEVQAVPMPTTDITVDEILREQGQSSDPALEDLDPRVEMSFDSGSKLLTVILSNEASYAGEPDAGHLLTGLGFNLLPGVSIEDVAGRDSSISLLGGSVILDPGGAGLSLSQDNWGFANSAMGHFSSTAQSSVGTVLSCMNSDCDVTFDRHDATNATMDAFDYGLQGMDPTPGHSVKPAIRNGLVLSLYLDGPCGTDWGSLLSHVENNPVVVSYGSPTSSSMVPEPATSSMCVAGLAALVVLGSRRRRAA